MLSRILVNLIKAYQLCVSPLLPPACRFHPTCSVYTLQAVQVHGGLRGSWLALRRLLRCHPWHEGGFDPVPGHRAGEARRGVSDNRWGPSRCR